MLLIVALIISIAFCENVDDGWKGIRPLKTSKATVDKLLGPSTIDGDGDHVYSDRDTTIRVTYSGEPCKNLPYGRGDYKVPINTVLHYIVRPNNFKTPLSVIQFDRKKYVRDTGGDVRFVVGYNQPIGGVYIQAFVEKESEYLHSITFHRTAEDAEKFKCS